MASKRKKYNARFPAGRIKRIMQTDEEVGKVAKAVPVIISRTLELFVESLLKKAMRVTLSRNAKTLSPSHLKQCIMAETRFDFLKDLVKAIPDVSAAEEAQSADSSPTTSRFSEPFPAKKVIKIETAAVPSYSGTDTKNNVPPPPNAGVLNLKRIQPTGGGKDMEEPTPVKILKLEPNAVVDLTSKKECVRKLPNFYQETLKDLDTDTKNSVIQPNPKFLNPLPSTSSPLIAANPSIKPNSLILRPLPPGTSLQSPIFTTSPPMGACIPNLKPSYMIHKPNIPPLRPIFPPKRCETVTSQNCMNNFNQVRMPITPVLNIDFTKNLENPEFKLMPPTAANLIASAQSTKSLERSTSLDSFQKKMEKATVINVQTQSYAPKPLDRLGSQDCDT